MKRKVFSVLSVVVLLSSLLAASPVSTGPVLPAAKSIQSLAMFQAAKFDAHYRVPRDESIEQMLDRKSTRLNSSHHTTTTLSRMPSSA
jgi:hypothetical protein